MVRLLTLWFDYGHWPEVYEALVEGIKTIQIDTWLQVIPQLIARIDTPRQLVGRLIHQLLTDIGKHHPQVLVLLLLLLLLLFVNDSHEINSGVLEDKEKNELKQCQYLENFIITQIWFSKPLNAWFIKYSPSFICFFSLHRLKIVTL